MVGSEAIRKAALQSSVRPEHRKHFQGQVNHAQRRPARHPYQIPYRIQGNLGSLDHESPCLSRDGCHVGTGQPPSAQACSTPLRPQARYREGTRSATGRSCPRQGSCSACPAARQPRSGRAAHLLLGENARLQHVLLQLRQRVPRLPAQVLLQFVKPKRNKLCKCHTGKCKSHAGTHAECCRLCRL